jgi:hypothetical protein
MTTQWEVFQPANGKPIMVTRWESLARLVSWWIGGDYAPRGWGWIDTETN